MWYVFVDALAQACHFTVRYVRGFEIADVESEARIHDCEALRTNEMLLLKQIYVPFLPSSGLSREKFGNGEMSEPGVFTVECNDRLHFG